MGGKEVGLDLSGLEWEHYSQGSLWVGELAGYSLISDFFQKLSEQDKHQLFVALGSYDEEGVIGFLDKLEDDPAIDESTDSNLITLLKLVRRVAGPKSKMDLGAFAQAHHPQFFSKNNLVHLLRWHWVKDEFDSIKVIQV